MILAALDRRPEAADACREAHELLVRGDDPVAEAQRLVVVDCALDLAEILLDEDERAEAEEWLDRARRRLDELLAGEGGWFLLPALKRLSDLAELWDRAERREDARQASATAVEHCRGLSTDDPEAAALGLPLLLYELGVRLANVDRVPEALERLAEAGRELIAHQPTNASDDESAAWRDLSEEVIDMARQVAADGDLAWDEAIEEGLLALLSPAPAHRPRP